MLQNLSENFMNLVSAMLFTGVFLVVYVPI